MIGIVRLALVEGVVADDLVGCKHRWSQVIKGFDLMQELRMSIGVQGCKFCRNQSSWRAPKIVEARIFIRDTDWF